ncbi:MAG TPA: FtsX-like permease family protein [Gemmatimonadales bacterium]|nr:FtsX-like permease family protein [Gemmatimonadales bacterium]
MNLRRAFETARWAVRAYPGSTALLAGASAVTVGVTLPALALGDGRLTLPPATDPGLPFDFSAFAGTPATMQGQGVDAIAGLLVALGVAALAVGIVTAGSLAVGRAAGRRSEISVRRAVGAARSSLRLSGLVEGMLLALGAIGVGLVPAVAAARWAVATWPGTLVPALVGALAAMAAVGGVLVLGALFGVRAPGGTRVPHPGASSHGLVIPAAQFAISLAILTGAARVGTRATQLLQSGELGLTKARAGSVVEIDNDASESVRATRYESLIRRLKSDPGFGLVGLASSGALVGMGPVDFVTTDCGQCREGFIYTPFRPVPAMIMAMTADTFRASGLVILRGRGLADTDSWAAPRVAVISATLAARDYKDGVAVGRKIFVGRGAGSGWYQVIGVVPDRRAEGIGGALAPAKAVYLSAFQAPPARAELLTDARPDQTIVAPAGRVTGETSLAQLRVREVSVMAWFGRLTRVAGWAVMIIALAGMVAVMERWVTAVAPELAIRRAVGARRWDVVRFILARAWLVCAVGAAGGAWLAIFVSGSLADAFPGLPAWSWAAALAIGGALPAATVVGAMVSGWRVVAVPPAAKLGELEA